MFDIIFMRQKWNETVRLIFNRATRTVYPLGSQFKLPRGTSSREQMCLLGHVNTKHRCVLSSQCEALEHKPNRRNTVCNCHGTRGSRNEETRILTNEVFNERQTEERQEHGEEHPNSFDT